MENQNGYYMQTEGVSGTNPYESPPQSPHGEPADGSQQNAYGNAADGYRPDGSGAAYGQGSESYESPDGSDAAYGQGAGGYGSPDGGGAAYGQGNGGYGNPGGSGPAYGPGNGGYGSPDGNGAAYGQGAGGFGNPQQGLYGQGSGAYGGPVYGQGTGSYAYGAGGMGYGAGPVPEDRFGMKLACSILEIVSCNVITMILGIIACVFTTKAHNSHKAGRWQEFRSEAKTSAICLWVGLGFFVAGLLILLAGWFTGNGLSGIVGGTGTQYVYVDGTRMDIPSDYSAYEDLGYYLDRSDRFETIDPGDHGLYLMRNDYGDYVMWCWFENSGRSEAYVSECDIIGVDVDIYCDNYERYQTSEGLGFFNSKQDFIDTYGRPDNTYKEDDDSELLCWYLGDKSDPMWRVMEVTFIDGRLYDIDVDYRR